jgi:sulfur carrier protein
VSAPAVPGAGPVPLVVNGDPREMAPGSTVLDLVATTGRDPRTVAVERNGDILPRDAYGTTELLAGDRIEIVHFVQGG